MVNASRIWGQQLIRSLEAARLGTMQGSLTNPASNARLCQVHEPMYAKNAQMRNTLHFVAVLRSPGNYKGCRGAMTLSPEADHWTLLAETILG